MDQSAKKYVVPEGMLKAAIEAYLEKARGQGFSNSWATVEEFMKPYIEVCVLGALEWLAQNPIEPTALDAAEMAEQVGKICNRRPFSAGDCVTFYAVEWQRRMFLAPIQKQEQDEPPNLGQRLKTFEIQIGMLNARLNTLSEMWDSYYRSVK